MQLSIHDAKQKVFARKPAYLVFFPSKVRYVKIVLTAYCHMPNFLYAGVTNCVKVLRFRFPHYEVVTNVEGHSYATSLIIIVLLV